MAVHWDPNPCHRAKFQGDFFLDLLWGQILRNILKLDSCGIWGLLYLFLFLRRKSCLDSLRVKTLLFILTTKCSTLTSLIFVSLVLSQVLYASLEGCDFCAFDIVITALCLPVAHLRSQVFFFSLDLIIRVPYIVAMQHRDILVSANGIFTFTNAKRVKNWVTLFSFRIGLRYLHFRLQNTTVKMLDDRTKIAELNFLDSLTLIWNFGHVLIFCFKVILPSSKPGKLLSLGCCRINHSSTCNWMQQILKL